MNYNSICSSCRHESGCSFIKHSENAIITCEEFDIEKTKEKAPESSLISLLVINSTQDFSGLCVNCDLRFTCNLQSSNSVKWHCEEFITV